MRLIVTSLRPLSLRACNFALPRHEVHTAYALVQAENVLEDPAFCPRMGSYAQ